MRELPYVTDCTASLHSSRMLGDVVGREKDRVLLSGKAPGVAVWLARHIV